jgi:hypothetical protein
MFIMGNLVDVQMVEHLSFQANIVLLEKVDFAKTYC